jgi:RNA polymerase sigma-70 factor (ECF subfamily)
MGKENPGLKVDNKQRLPASKKSETDQLTVGSRASSGLNQPEGWLRSAIAGDVDAFGELYQLHARAIFGYCLHRVHTPADAEDLAAQVFLKAWEALPRFEMERAPFEAWLFRIAHNLVVNYYRHHQRHPEVADAGLEPTLVESFSEEAALVEGRSPLQNLFVLSDYTALYSALEKLNEEQRQVIYLRFMQNMSHAQIGAMLGKKEGTIRGIQFRAMEALEKILTKEGFSRDG